MGIMNDPRKQAKYLKYLGVAMTGGGVVITLAFPTMLTALLSSLMVLKEGSSLTSLWAEPPIGVPMNTYVFSVENPEEFKLGAKIRLKQMGPYTYE